jgi:hypothetical protein
MRRIALAILAVFWAARAMYAQAPASEPFPPQTKLEAFIATKGELVVKEFYELGAFSGQLGSLMKIDAAVVYQPGREQQRLRGLRIQVTSSGRVENTQTSFLDLDEVESLSNALGYLADAETNKKGTTGLTIAGGIVAAPPYTEFEFSTKDDFRIGFFRRINETSAYAVSGRINPARLFFKPSDFLTIKGLVDKGLTILKAK